jgi:HD-like signal output (HDOD) protein
MPAPELNPAPTAGQADLLKELVSFLIDRKVLSATDVKRVLQIQARLDKRFGTLAALKSFIAPHDVIFILYKQTDSDEKMGRLAVKLGLMTEDQVKDVLHLQTSPSRQFIEVLVRTRTVPPAALQKAMREFSERKVGARELSAGRLADGQDFSFTEQPARFDADKLKVHLRNLRDLATLPGVVHRVLGLLQNPHVDMLDVAAVIDGDPALSVRLLRLANSAFFGLITKVGTVHKALITLGVNNVRKTVITASVLEKFKGIDQQEAAEHWRHSLLTSRWSRRLLEMQGLAGEILEDGGMAGLLHDTGKLAVWQYFANANAEIRKMIKGGRSGDEAEHEVLGMSHAEIGAFVFQIWNFPPNLLQATCYHHTAVAEFGNLKETLPLTTCVNAACRIAHLPLLPQEDGTKRLDPSSLDPEFIAFHRLNLDALVNAAPTVIEEADEMQGNFFAPQKTERKP